MIETDTTSNYRNTIYKVMTNDVWQQAVKNGHFSGSEDDVRDGFIHLSAAHQLLGTLAKYYRNVPDLVLIAFTSADFGTALKWEVSRGGDLFPHLYGTLPTSLAKAVIPLSLGDDGVPLLPQKMSLEVN